MREAALGKQRVMVYLIRRQQERGQNDIASMRVHLTHYTGVVKPLGQMQPHLFVHAHSGAIPGRKITLNHINMTLTVMLVFQINTDSHKQQTAKQTSPRSTLGKYVLKLLLQINKHVI